MGKRDATPEIDVELLSGQVQAGETTEAVIACNDWLRLGAGRSLPRLLANYTETYQGIPPTESLATLKNWSKRFQWSERAVAYDANWEARKTAERHAVMEYGLSLDFERVRKLDRLAGLLEQQLYKRDEDGQLTNLWVEDVKSIGSGAFAERVDIVRFNSALVEQYRKTLADIAEETGGRIRKQEITGADGGPLEIKAIDYRAGLAAVAPADGE